MNRRPTAVRWSHPWPDDQGCFETMRAYDGRIAALDAHVERLWASARALRLPVEANPSSAKRVILTALTRSRLRSALVRVQLVGAQLRVIVEPFQSLPSQWFRDGISAVTVPTRKTPIAAIDYQSKASARLGSVLATIEATQRGGIEALQLGREGWVTETTVSNLFAVRGRVVTTPPTHLGVLAGVTRQLVMTAARQGGLRVAEQPLTRHDCYNAQEVFLSSTTKEILPVVRLDGRVIGAGCPGPISRRLHEVLQRLIKDA